MSVAILQSFGEPIWIPAYRSAKIVGSGVMQHSRAESKVQNASNAMGCTNLNTIGNLASAARWTPRLTRQDWKQKKRNHAFTHSSARIAEETTKRTPINVHFGDIGSIGNGIRGSMLRSVKTDPNRFVLKEIVEPNNNCEKPQNFFAKRSQKLPHCQYPPRDFKLFRYHPNLRTSLVWNPKKYLALWIAMANL